MNLNSLQIHGNHRRTLIDDLSKVFDNWVADDDMKMYSRPQTFTQIHFGAYDGQPMAIKIMKDVPYSKITKSEIGQDVVRTGELTDYEKEIKMLQILKEMHRARAIPFHLPLIFSKFADYREVKPYLGKEHTGKKRDKYAVYATPRMDSTFNQYINANTRTRDPSFFNVVDVALFVVLFNVYSLNTAIGFVHCDLHISNLLMKKLDRPRTCLFKIMGKNFCFIIDYEICFYDMFYSMYNDCLGRQGSIFYPKLNGLEQDEYYKNDIGLFAVTLLKYVKNCKYVKNETLENFLHFIVGGKENVKTVKNHVRLHDYAKVQTVQSILNHSYFARYTCTPDEVLAIQTDSDVQKFSVKGKLVKKNI
jgi:hypothetical protein